MFEGCPRSPPRQKTYPVKYYNIPKKRMRLFTGGKNHRHLGGEPAEPGTAAPYPGLLGHLAPAGLAPRGEAAVQGDQEDPGVRHQGVRAEARDAAVAHRLLQLTRGERGYGEGTRESCSIELAAHVTFHSPKSTQKEVRHNGRSSVASCASFVSCHGTDHPEKKACHLAIRGAGKKYSKQEDGA